MNHCVPDWDESGADIDARPARDSVVSSLKTNRRQATPDCAKFLDNEFSELIWTPDGDLVMQVHTNRSLKNPQWVSSGFSSGENEDRVAPSKLPDRIKDDTLDAVVISAVRADSLPSNAGALTYAEEDDLISWLQYPDDSLDKNDCSDIFNLPSSQLQVLKDPVNQSVREQQSLASGTPENPGVMTRAGAGETSSIVVENNIPLSQGSDALIRMCTTITPTVTPWVTLKNGTLSHSPKKPHISDTSVSGVTLSASRLPPKPQKVNSAGPLNFSHFSRPAAIAKASLHTLGKCSTGITNHLQEQLKKNDTAGSNAVECSIGSVTTARSAMTHNEEFHVQGQSSDAQQSLGSQSSSWPTLKSSASRKELIADCKDNYPNSSAALDTNEQTFTSSSGGSGNSADRVKQSIVKAGKRKSKDVDDSTECQSEDAEGESVHLKKASPARPGSKRSRAAEVHNQSERRRRDRINEKMKALQELIPNSNKTDKASMLDEAIEYLKMLQLQLQMMSMRSGLSLPPMIIPAGMQHLQMPQVATLPHMGMGMGVGMGLGMIGMGMGMGVGLMDMNGAATVRPMMPLPLAGPGQPSAATMPVNVDMYHAYILHQQQQIQQQMQLQHQQIQQTQNQQLQPQQQQQQQQPQQQQQQPPQQQKTVASSGTMQ